MGIKRSNEEQLKEFLKEHASDEEIREIAFDRFRKVYDDFEVAGLKKSQRVRMLVDHCRKRKRLPELAEIVAEKFPELYSELDLDFSEPVRIDNLKKVSGYASETNSVQTQLERKSTYISPQNWLLFAIPLSLIVSVGSVHLFFWRNPELAPLGAFSPWTAPLHMILFASYIFLLLPYVLWGNDNRSRVDVNKAQLKDLTSRAIADTYAQRILAHREKNGAFVSIDEVKDLSTLNDKTRTSLDKYCRIGLVSFSYPKYGMIVLEWLHKHLVQMLFGK